MKIFPHPEIIFETASFFSGDIKVVGNGPERRLLVGGLTQSVSRDFPDVQKKVWGQLLNFPFEVSPNPEVLALGLGGATTIHIANKKFKPKSIQAIEIDPSIINIAQNYFDLEKIPGLSVVNGDAVEHLKNFKSGQFDLIIVDIYLGQEFPIGASSTGFYINIKKVLRKGGVVSINRIFYDRPSHDPEIGPREKFCRLLGGVFGTFVEKVLPGTTSMKNYLYFAKS